MEKFIWIALIVFVFIFMSPTVYAEHTRNSSGRTTFVNNSSGTRCYSVFWNSGGVRNFCLRAGQRESMRVRQGDSYCCVRANHRPSSNCNEYYIEIGTETYCP